MKAYFWALPILLSFNAPVSATGFNAVYAFGDSLSDNGALHSNYPPAPYDNGRLSNGPVAVEYLAQGLGLALNDYAFAGATTGILNPDAAAINSAYLNSGIAAQIAGYVQAVGSADPNALYFIWGGANDLLNAFNPVSANPLADLQAAANTAVSNIVNEVKTLQNVGAEHFLVPNLNLLGYTPEVIEQGPQAQALANAATVYFDQLLAASLPSQVTLFDTAAFVTAFTVQSGNYGFTNTQDACLTTTTLCNTPDAYFYWDSLHPTTAANKYLGNAFAAAVVPVPAGAWLMLSGLAVLLVNKKRYV
jgi:cholinesterase